MNGYKPRIYVKKKDDYFQIYTMNFLIMNQDIEKPNYWWQKVVTYLDKYDNLIQEIKEFENSSYYKLYVDLQR